MKHSYNDLRNFIARAQTEQKIKIAREWFKKHIENEVELVYWLKMTDAQEWRNEMNQI